MIEILNNKYNNVNWSALSNPFNRKSDYINGSLLEYCMIHKLRYILIESNRSESMDSRIDQNKTIIEYIFDKYLT